MVPARAGPFERQDAPDAGKALHGGPHLGLHEGVECEVGPRFAQGGEGRGAEDHVPQPVGQTEEDLPSPLELQDGLHA